MIVDFTQMSPSQIYHVMTQTIIPRPIAWVLTTYDNNTYNLAPFSYFTAISSEPPLLMISVGKKPDGSQKDTVINAKNNGDLVIHIADQSQADVLTKTAETLKYGESEVTKHSIHTSPFDDNGSLPRLTDCNVAFSCRVYDIKEIGNTPQTLIFAEIKKAYFAPSIIRDTTDGRLVIDAIKIDPLARLGGGEYAGITQPTSVKRPS